MLSAKDIVKDLQEMRDQGYLSDALLRKAVKGIAGADDRFDWVGALLLREGGETLWLHNYVGSAAEHAELPVAQGACGKAVRDKANQRVADIAGAEGQVALGPDTRAEMVVLIRAGSEIFGGIGLESEQAGAFTDADEAAVQAVADKLAEQLVAERR